MALEIVAAILFAVVVLTGGSDSQLELLENPDELVDELPVKDWAKLWVEQKFSPITKSSLEKNGRCGYDMSQNVRFISFRGAESDDEKIECRISAGKFLFAELTSNTVLGNPPGYTCNDAYDVAREEIDDVKDTVFEINGSSLASLEPYRRRITDCPDPHRFTERPRRYSSTAADGYFLMFRPLNPGVYRLAFTASDPCWFDERTSSRGCPDVPTRRKVTLRLIAE